MMSCGACIVQRMLKKPRTKRSTMSDRQWASRHDQGGDRGLQTPGSCSRRWPVRLVGGSDCVIGHD